MRYLILTGRITAFKSLAVSKLTHLWLVTKLHINTIDILYKIQKNLVLFCNGYEKGGIKNVDSIYKVTSI